MAPFLNKCTCYSVDQHIGYNECTVAFRVNVQTSKHCVIPNFLLTTHNHVAFAYDDVFKLTALISKSTLS